MYEQRVIRRAVIARTGHRYINGQTTDEGLFKYLMNNAARIEAANDLRVRQGSGHDRWVLRRLAAPQFNRHLSSNELKRFLNCWLVQKE